MGPKTENGNVSARDDLIDSFQQKIGGSEFF